MKAGPQTDAILWLKVTGLLIGCLLAVTLACGCIAWHESTQIGWRCYLIIVSGVIAATVLGRILIGLAVHSCEHGYDDEAYHCTDPL